MQDKNYYSETEKMNIAGTDGSDYHGLLPSSEQVRRQALALYIIRSTAEKHGGNVEIDLASDSLSITLPEKEKAACVQEIEAQLESMRI